MCSPQGSSPVKIKHASISRTLRIAARTASTMARLSLLMIVAFSAVAALAQTSQTIEQIRVIGNRRIPKETILARLFTHPGDTYDPVSIERDFNSLWNTGYFEDLRIEREDTEKGIILNVFVRERPTIREINYKGNSSVSTSDILDRFKKEKVGLSVEGQFDPTKIKRAESVFARNAGGAWPSVRHHQDRCQDHSSRLGAGELQHQGRPDGKSRQDQFHRQPAPERS